MRRDKSKLFLRVQFVLNTLGMSFVDLEAEYYNFSVAEICFGEN